LLPYVRRCTFASAVSADLRENPPQMQKEDKDLTAKIKRQRFNTKAPRLKGTER